MLKLIFINIKNFFEHYPPIFFLFLFGIFISIIAILFTSDVFTSIYNYNSKYSPFLRTITVNRVSTINNVNKLSLELQKNKLLVNNITVHLQKQPIKASVYYNTYSKLFVQTGTYFNSNDFYRGNYQIVSIPNSNNISHKVGETLTFLGRAYKIIGFFSVSDYYEVPFKSLAQDTPISTIQIECVKDISTNEGHALATYVKSYFGNEAVSLPTMTLWTPQILLEYSFCILISLMALLGNQT